MIRRVVALALSASLLLLTAGCQVAPPTDLVTGEASAPSSTSRTELVGQAKQLYEKYLVAVEEISERGNRDVAMLQPLATKEAYQAEVASFKTLDSRGVHTTGATKLVVFRPQKVDAKTGELTAYACVDLSSVKVIDADGKDVTPTARPNRQTSLPRFVTQDGSMRLAENGTWSGDSIC